MFVKKHHVNLLQSDFYLTPALLKNIIVLKNLPSNLIDEAIVVLKHNVNSKSILKTQVTKKLFLVFRYHLKLLGLWRLFSLNFLD